MMELLTSLEGSTFSTWLRESNTIWAYPAVLTLHTVGLALLVGANTALDLRLLGVAPGIPLAELVKSFRVMWIGFWINAASGVALLIGYPTKALTNPVFYTKLLFVALGLVALMVMKAHVFRDPRLDENPVPRKGRMLAVASLACWAGAITTGRLLAYTYVRLLSI